MSDLTEEDAKLVALARQARARIQAKEGAAVRDETGRSYSGATIELPSTHLSALQLAIAQAVAAGARDIEAAVVITPNTDANTDNKESPDTSPVTEAASTPTPVHICSLSGDVIASTIVEA